MPRPPLDHTLAGLIQRCQVLHIGCNPCGKDRYLSPLEAVASYGGMLTFEELTGLLRSRCRKDCHLVAQPSIRGADELTVKKRNAR
jgi:hypothetical protein